jgi:hypothetical protein
VRHHAWVRSKTSGGLLSVLTLLVATLASAPPAVTHNSDNHPPDDIYIPADGNGWKIYLSPAHHWTGPNYGCDNYVEDDNMPLVALYAGILASGGDGSLYDRGYSVRLGRGDPDDNVMRANAWGSDRYIALHSNAKGDAQCGAGAANAGTWAYYRPGSPASQNLAMGLKNKVGAVGPGTNDQILSGSEFYEINQPNAPPVLLEAEFHDYQAGKDWLVGYSNWAWRIAWAVDDLLGYQ